MLEKTAPYKAFLPLPGLDRLQWTTGACRVQLRASFFLRLACSEPCMGGLFWSNIWSNGNKTLKLSHGRIVWPITEGISAAPTMCKHFRAFIDILESDSSRSETKKSQVNWSLYASVCRNAATGRGHVHTSGSTANTFSLDGTLLAGLVFYRLSLLNIYRNLTASHQRALKKHSSAQRMLNRYCVLNCYTLTASRPAFPLFFPWLVAVVCHYTYCELQAAKRDRRLQLRKRGARFTHNPKYYLPGYPHALPP